MYRVRLAADWQLESSGASVSLRPCVSELHSGASFPLITTRIEMDLGMYSLTATCCYSKVVVKGRGVVLSSGDAQLFVTITGNNFGQIQSILTACLAAIPTRTMLPYNNRSVDIKQRVKSAKAALQQQQGNNKWFEFLFIPNVWAQREKGTNAEVRKGDEEEWYHAVTGTGGQAFSVRPCLVLKRMEW